MIHLRIVALVCLGILQVPCIPASGVLHVEVLSYTNPGTSRSRPPQLCCDGNDSDEPACSLPCDIFLSICISKENLKSRFPKGLTDADNIDCTDGKLIDARLPAPFGYPDGAKVPTNLHFKTVFDGKWYGYQNIRLQLRRGDKQGNSQIVDRFSVNYFKTEALDEGTYFAKAFTASGIRPNSTAKLELRVAAVCDYTASRSVAPYCENAPCTPTDDCTGHYTCHPTTGKKVCLNGWTGTNCNERLALLPACVKDHKCANGAPCIVNGTSSGDYYCCCTVGWHGTDCSEPAGIDFARLRVKTTSIDDEFNSLRSDPIDEAFMPADIIIGKPEQPQIRQVRQAPVTIRVGAQMPESGGRVLLVPTPNATAPGFAGHRPLFNINAQTDPQIFSSLQLVNLISPVDASFGVHKVAVMNTPKSIQELETALQTAWWNANFGNKAQGLSQNAVVIKIVQFRDYGLFSDQGIPVIEATYAVGLNRSAVPGTFDPAAVNIRLPDIQGLSRSLQAHSLQICDCDVYEGRYLHLVGIVPSVTAQYQSAMQATWLAVGPELRCGNCQVKVVFARTVITVGTAGVRLTTVPYVVLLNNKVWATPSFVNTPLDPNVIEAALATVGQSVQVYRGTQLPVYAALAFVNYLNANIQFQDIPHVQRSVQSYLDARMPRPPLLATVWNLEPFLDPTANVITQSSYFLSLPNGEVMDPRLFYAPPVIGVLAKQNEGNVSVVTGETLGIHPVYLYGDLNPALLRSVAEILKLSYAEQNSGLLNPDDVQVAVVSMDTGVVSAVPPASGMQRVTELHVSAMVGGVDPDRLPMPNLSPFHQMLTNPDSQNAIDTRLAAFETRVCRNCQFRKLRTLNLLQVDPSTSAVADAQAIMDKVFAAWIAANPESPWLPMNLMLAGRDDSLANENGTLVSQLLYSVGYPLPNFNWYIPRDPSNDNLERQLALVKAVPFFGTPIQPQRISLNKHMTAADQTLFATAAMRAWAEDKDDLKLCLLPDANCFIAVADAESPAVTNNNGNPQFLYKYFILVNDKVYTPTSPLSSSQMVKLRSTMDATTGASGPGGAVLIIAPPAGSNLTIAVTQVPTTSATTPRPPPLTLPGGGAAPLPVNFTHSLNMVVGTQREKTAVLDAVKNVWAMALSLSITNIQLTTLSDSPGYPDPFTADGLPIRTVVYLVQGTPTGTYNLQNSMVMFNQLLPAANIRAIQMATPAGATQAPPIPAFVVDFGQTPVNQSGAAVIVPVAPAANQTAPQQIVPIVPRSPAAQSTTTTTTQAPVNVAVIPVVIPAAPTGTTMAPHVITGPFIIRDVVAITADTKRTRDRIMDEQIKPNWKTALGPDIPSFNLIVKNDQTYSTPSTPDGNSIRQITYDIAGISPVPLDTTAALNRFHNLAGSAGLHDLWAIPDQYGNMVLASTIPKMQMPGMVAVVTPAPPANQTTAATAVIIPIIIPPAGPTTTTARVPTTRKPVVAHGEFHLPDSIAVTADTRRQRDRILSEEIKPIWREAFGHNVTDAISFTVKGDSTFSPPNTPEGKSIRRIDYTVDGMSTIDLNFNEHADLFHVLALNAGLPSLFAVPDPYGNWVLASSIPKKTTTTPPAPTAANATGLAVIPIIIPVPEQATTVAPVHVPTRPPLMVPAGPFVIDDVVAVVADTKRQRDRAMEDQMKPNWLTALGPSVTDVQLLAKTDTTYTPMPVNENGNSVRQVTYQVNGVTTAPLDTNAAIDRFHDLVGTAKPKDVYAVQDVSGNMVPVATYVVVVNTPAPGPIVILPGLDNKTAIVTPNGTMIVTVPMYEPRATGSLLLKSYSDSDAGPVQETLDQMWAGALGVSAESVKVIPLNSSGPTGQTSTEGTPVYSYNYLLATQPNVTTSPADALPTFIQMISSGDLPLVEQDPVPIQSPANASEPAVAVALLALLPVVLVTATTTATPVGPVVIPVLSFKESQDVAIADQTAPAALTSGLQHLWAQAANVDDPAVQIAVNRLTPADPARVAQNGMPVQTLLYDVTIQNASDVNAIRAREKELAPQSSIASMLVLPAPAADATNGTVATIVPLIPLIAVPVETATSTVATIIVLPSAPPVYYHTLDAHVANMDVLNQLQGDLGLIWSQAYGIPQNQVNVTVQGTQQVGMDEQGRPISRVQYAVQVNGRNETPEVVQAFDQLIQASPVSQILVVPVAAPLAKTAHSLEIAASNPQEMDAVTTALRASWISVLGLDQQPGAATITLTSLAPENIATQNGVRVQNMTYDVTVPPNVEVGPTQEQAVHDALLKSAARPYIFVRGELIPPANTTGIPVGPIPVSGPVPFSFTDSIIIAAPSKPARDNTMNSVRQAWFAALAPSVPDVQTVVTGDKGFSPPTTEEGLPIRAITYNISGVSNTGPLDEYDAKQKFRQVLQTIPITNVYQVPPLGPRPVTTAAAETTTVSTAAIVPVVLTTAAPTETTTNATGVAVLPVIIPVPLPEEVATTAVPPVTQMKFLQLKRPMKAGDEAEIAALIAAAWAQSNNRSSNDVVVSITNVAPAVDDHGLVSSNITYSITAAPGLQPPTGPKMTEVLGQKNWTVCDRCFMVPIQKVYMTMLTDPAHMDPSTIRTGLTQATIQANPSINPGTINTGFPQDMPPMPSAVVSPDQRRLLAVNYFSAGIDKNSSLLAVAPASVEQIQAQFPDRAVFGENDPRLHQPIVIFIQRRDDVWKPEYDNPQQVRANIRAEVDRIADQAVKNVAARMNLPCNDGCTGKVLEMADLYGRFGRHFLRVSVYPENLGSGYPDATVQNEIRKEVENLMNASPQPIAVSGASELSTMASDPERVYFRDFKGRPTIYDIKNNEKDLLKPWLDLNPDCKPVGAVECGLNVLMLSAESRQSIADGSRVTRIYYIVKSKSPYTKYPLVKDISIPMPSQRLKSVALPKMSKEEQHKIAERFAHLTPAHLKERQIRYRRQAEAAAAAVNPDSPAVENVAPPVDNVAPPVQNGAQVVENVAPPVPAPAVVENVAPVVNTAPVVVAEPAQTVDIRTMPTAVQIQLPNATVIQQGTISTMYCFLHANNSFVPYFIVTVPANATETVVAVAAPTAPGQPVSAAQVAGLPEMTYGAPQCTQCQCGIPAYKILLKGHVPPEEVFNVTQLIGRAWRDTHGPTLEEMADVKLDQWAPYFVGTPNYQFRDPVYGNLTYLEYVILVVEGTTQDLLIPDMTDEQLTNNALLANSSYPPCIDCQPTLDKYAYVGGLTGNENRDGVVRALTDSWNMDNPKVVTPNAAFVVAPNYNTVGGYSAKIGDATIPVQRLDYAVSVPNRTGWAMLDYPDTPGLETLNSRFRTELGPNVTVYPFENVTVAQLQRLSDDSGHFYNVNAPGPSWLPAAIIVPLFGAIVMALIIVCLITRASRIFRSKKTVVITDPAMIQTMHPNDSPFKEGNGKSNYGYDVDHHAGVRQDISKV